LSSGHQTSPTSQSEVHWAAPKHPKNAPHFRSLNQTTVVQLNNPLMPMEKVVTVSVANSDKAYPYSITRELHVINDEIAKVPVVVFLADGAVSALDKESIASSRKVGSTGVFDRRVDGRTLSFRYSDGRFYDKQTTSAWDITGQAVQGPLQGKKMTRIVHGDYFAFAWLAFKPETEIYQ